MEITLFKKWTYAIDDRLILMGIASVNIFLGLSIVIMTGAHDKDWPFLQTLAMTTILGGVLLLYGTKRCNQASMIASLIFSGLSLLLYVLASIKFVMRQIDATATSQLYLAFIYSVCIFACCWNFYSWIYVLRTVHT